MNNIEHFESINKQMLELYTKKNHDYGNSFEEGLDEDGLVAAKIRLGDKFRRFSKLIKEEAQVNTESIEDTLIDMANYSIMTLMWLEKKHQKSNSKPDQINSEDVCNLINKLSNTFEDGIEMVFHVGYIGPSEIPHFAKSKDKEHYKLMGTIEDMTIEGDYVKIVWRNVVYSPSNRKTVGSGTIVSYYPINRLNLFFK